MDASIALTGAAACAALGAYHHVLYPSAMAVLGRRAPALPAAPHRFPTIEFLMPAYNEEAFIARKIAAIAASDYPMDKVRIVVGCDGCTDGTAKAARDAAMDLRDVTVVIREFPRNRGKTAVLNALIDVAQSDIVVFSDVSAIPAPDALSRTAQWFEDARIGAVGGGYGLSDQAGHGETLYWRYQSAVKRGESRLAGLVGAHGAFYAVRRRCLQPIPKDTINDDFVIPMQIAAAGWRTIYDTSIRVHETEIVGNAADSRRRRRIGAGNFQQMVRLAAPVTKSAQVGLMLAFFSGKSLRVAMGPLFLIGLACLAAAAPSSLIAAAALVIVGLASAAPGPGRYAVNGHVQSMIGAIQYVAGKHRRWNRVGTADAAQSV